MHGSPASEVAVFRIAFSIESEELRKEYLQRVCGSDRTLYNRVSELLQANREPEFLEFPPTGVGPTIDLPSITERPGTLVGRYRLFEDSTKGMIHDYTGGIPRQINNLATACLLLASAENALRRPTTGRHFTRQSLYRVRNGIPVADLLVRLQWPHKQREGRFVFLCPACSEFLTATNLRTNLGRCFACERNFNPIDLVMLIEDVDFVTAIHMLQSQLPAAPSQ